MSASYQLLNTLYVTTSGSYLHLDNDTVRVEVERETRLRVPLHHLGGIVCFGDVLVSPALIGRCAEGGIGLTLLDRNGRFKARVEGPVSGNVLLRRAQFLAVENPDACLRLARQFVLGKLRNGRVVLQRAARESRSADDAAALEATVRRFDAALRAALVASDLDALRAWRARRRVATSRRSHGSSVQTVARHSFPTVVVVVHRATR